MNILNLIKNLKNKNQLIQIRLWLSVKMRSLKNSNQLIQIRLRLGMIKNKIMITVLENTKKHKKLSVITILVSCIFVIFMLLDDSNEKNDIELEKTEITDSLIEKLPEEVNEIKSSEQTGEIEVKTETKEIAKKKVKKKNLVKLPSKKKLEPEKLVKEPRDVIQSLHDGLLSIKTNQTGNLDKIMNLIQNTYRLEKMLSLIIGKEWKNVSVNKKTELVNIFSEYISKNYIRRLRQINKPIFATNEIKDFGKNYKMVTTQLIIGSEKVSINYLLNEVNGYWRIFDILLAGSVSEIATKKSEFASFISKNNVDPLIEAITKKNKILLSE